MSKQPLCREGLTQQISFFMLFTFPDSYLCCCPVFTLILAVFVPEAIFQAAIRNSRVKTRGIPLVLLNHMDQFFFPLFPSGETHILSHFLYFCNFHFFDSLPFSSVFIVNYCKPKNFLIASIASVPRETALPILFCSSCFPHPADFILTSATSMRSKTCNGESPTASSPA